MTDKNLIKRWYDKDDKIARVVEQIKTLPVELQEELAVNILQFINLIRKNKKESESPLSLGKNRTLGLYKAYNKRRWYDKNPTLMSAMNSMAALPIDDCRNIAEGILETLNNLK